MIVIYAQAVQYAGVHFKTFEKIKELKIEILTKITMWISEGGTDIKRRLDHLECP